MNLSIDDYDENPANKSELVIKQLNSEDPNETPYGPLVVQNAFMMNKRPSL